MLGNLFSLVNNKVVVSPEIKLIQDFSTLSELEFGYVFFTQDYKSPYNSYPEETRKQKVKEDLGITKELNGTVEKACKKYSELQETTSMKLLKSARLAINKLTEFFEKEGPKSRNYVNNLGQIGKLIESIDRLEEKVKKEVSVEGHSKAGRDINHFEK